MARVKFTYKDKAYVLGYNRKTISQMERNGFVLSEVFVKPMSGFHALFDGAFLLHHRDIKQNLADEIYSKMSNKFKLDADGNIDWSDETCLMFKLLEDYKEQMDTLSAEPEDDAEKVEWSAV